MAEREDYLHSCLRLHGQVTESRYGKRQDLGKVESRVAHLWQGQAPMWDVVDEIHGADAFDASMFGSFDLDSLRSAITAIDHTQWRDLVERKEHEELVGALFEAYRQMEPASLVLRFIDPNRFGILSSPVQTVLGIRPLRKPTEPMRSISGRLMTSAHDGALNE